MSMTDADWADLGRPDEDKATQLVDSTGQPARLPKTAKCPQCGAGPDQRVTSGLGPLQSVTCQQCAYDFEPERAS